MGPAIRRLTATVLSTTLIVTLVASATLFGAALPVAAEHPDDAPDLSDKANFKIALPEQTDHYPGDQNEQNGSIEYFASAAGAFEELDAEEGVWINYIIVDASWIDYSNCETANTKAFGIDRGNNNSGTKVDEDLIEHQEEVDFRDDGITINFLDWEDIANGPPYLAPEDAIVAAQGKGSNDGPCFTATSEPGWYQIEGFMNGTVANGDCTEENNAQCEPENKEEKSLTLNSNYTYICECNSEAEAREQLGPPPGEETTPTPDDSTPTPTADDGGEDTPTPTADDGGEDTPTPTATQANNGGGNNGGGNGTPTAGSGPGFGSLVAITALLASALLLYRRD